MISYYIIGSKYEEEPGKFVDKFEEMLKKKVVSIGWASKYNMSKYYGKNEEAIVNYLKSIGEGIKSYSALKLFLNLRPEDIMAVKENSYPKISD